MTAHGRAVGQVAALVPRPVAAELEARPRARGGAFLKRRNVRRVEPNPDQRRRAAQLSIATGLGAADASALVLAKALGTILLTDDLDLRDAAKAIDVRPVGSIGVLVRAAAMGVLPKERAVKALDALVVDSSWFIRQRLVGRAMKTVQGPER